MLSILGQQLATSPRHPRREFLRVGALGSLGLGLPEMLALQNGAVAAGPTTTFGRAKRCILMHLWGAAPHQDTFDLKPEAPAEVRGPFLPIPTNVSGVEIGDHLPLLSRHAEKFTIVRSVNHREGDHQAAFHDMMTGNRYQWLDKRNAAKPTDNPNIGAVLSHLKPRKNGLPEYVQLPSLLQTNSGKIVPGQNAGFLGKSFDPFLVKAVDNYKPAHDPGFTDFNPPAFRNPGGSLSNIRIDRRRKLLASVEDGFDKAERGKRLVGFDDYYQQAFSLVASSKARQAFNLAAEPPEVRSRYGFTPFGQSCLLARRLVEVGVPLVNIYWRNGRRRTDIGWDNHINNFANLKNWQLPPTDMAVAALFDELGQRGLLEDTLVVLMGEFGRTPGISAEGGRQHWPFCYSVVMAGAGISGGQVFGASDSKAGYPARDAVSPFDIGASIFHLLGVDVTRVFHDFLGRPHRVCKGTPITELVGT